MTVAWVLICVGAILGSLGVAVGVATAVVSHQELMRWLVRRLRGDMPSSAAFAKPTRTRRVASALSALGFLMIGVGSVAIWPRDVGTRVGLIVLAVAVIIFFVYGMSHTAGRMWPDSLVRVATPWMDRIGFWMGPVMPPSVPSIDMAIADALRSRSDTNTAMPHGQPSVSGVWDYTTRPVREVMTPRTELVTLKQGASLEEVANIFAESRFARIPIIGESLDDIIGMVYGFDLLKIPPGGELPVRPVSTTPGLKTCAEVLLDLQRDRRQLAVVLDEFGGTAGIVTMEDLLTVLVGDMDNEEETETGPSVSGIVELAGTDSVTELESRFDLPDLEGSTTVGGFLARAAGRIPEAGDRFTLNGVEFDVIAATKTKVERVIVRRTVADPIELHPRDGS